MRPRGDSVSRRVTRYVGHDSRHMPQWMHPRAGSVSNVIGAMVTCSTLDGHPTRCEDAVRIEALLERPGDLGRESLFSPCPEGSALLGRCSLEDQRAATCLALRAQRGEVGVRPLAKDERAAGPDMCERVGVEGVGLMTGRQRRTRNAVGANGQRDELAPR